MTGLVTGILLNVHIGSCGCEFTIERSLTRHSSFVKSGILILLFQNVPEC